MASANHTGILESAFASKGWWRIYPVKRRPRNGSPVVVKDLGTALGLPATGCLIPL
jgi:hypothetical protein